MQLVRASVLHCNAQNPTLKPGMGLITPASLPMFEQTANFDALQPNQQRLVAQAYTLAVTSAAKATSLQFLLRNKVNWNERFLLAVSKYATLMPVLLSSLEATELIVLGANREDYFTSELMLHKFSRDHLYYIKSAIDLADQLLHGEGEPLHRLLGYYNCLNQHKRVGLVVHQHENSGLSFLGALKSLTRFVVSFPGLEDVLTQAEDMSEQLLPRSLIEEAFNAPGPTWTADTTPAVSVVTQYLQLVNPTFQYCIKMQVNCPGRGTESQADVDESQTTASWSQPPPAKKRQDTVRSHNPHKRGGSQPKGPQPPRIPVPPEARFKSATYPSKVPAHSSW